MIEIKCKCQNKCTRNFKVEEYGKTKLYFKIYQGEKYIDGFEITKDDLNKIIEEFNNDNK
jgi:hypothetical protein